MPATAVPLRDSRTKLRRIAVVLTFTSLALLAMPKAEAATSAEVQSLSLINKSRAAARLAPLRLGTTLSNYARRHSTRMAAAGKLWHQNLPVDLRSWGLRYYGENVGYGSSVSAVHTAFMKSAGHRANILKGAYRWVGVGVVQSGGRSWVTLVFTS